MLVSYVSYVSYWKARYNWRGEEMPRQPRLDIPGLVHHVMVRGIVGRDIFRDDGDRGAFLTRLIDGVGRPGGPQLYAWALMPNHLRLLLRSGEGRLSPMMRQLMTGHAVTYNLRYMRQGHLFQNRYKSIVVEEETYVLELVRYILTYQRPRSAERPQSSKGAIGRSSWIRTATCLS